MLTGNRRRGHAAGFTVVELMITIGVLAILTAVGLPSFRGMLMNFQVRAAAEGAANGMRRARAEAVARNTSVYFLLGTGTSWTVDYVTKPVSTDPVIDSRDSSEGSANATLTATAADLTTAATTITFNNLGQIIANADASPTLRRIVFTASGASDTMHVFVNAGGGAKTCNPGLPSTNANACQAGE